MEAGATRRNLQAVTRTRQVKKSGKICPRQEQKDMFDDTN